MKLLIMQFSHASCYLVRYEILLGMMSQNTKN